MAHKRLPLVPLAPFEERLADFDLPMAVIAERLGGLDLKLTAKFLRLHGAALFIARGARRVTLADLAKIVASIRARNQPGDVGLADALSGMHDTAVG